MPSKSNKIEFVDYSLKLIPLLILVFLIVNFIFNAGYFYNSLGLKFFSILTIRDYYEGTAPLMTFNVILYIGVLNAVFYSKYFSLTPDLLELFYISFIQMPFKFIFIKFLSILKYKTKKNKTYYDKRIAVIARKQIKKLLNLKKNVQKKYLSISIFYIGAILVILFPFYNFYYTCYNHSKYLFYTLCLLYLLLIIGNTKDKKNIRKIQYLLSIIILCSILFCIGNVAFLEDYSNKDTKLMYNNKEYSLVRGLSNGVIITDYNKIIFIKWDNVKDLYIEINKKSKNKVKKNAK